MDLEQLTKHQILLLTLLVSFVTSIATGIVTVSLMDQAPEGVTRVINQIVERTVETVVPDTQGAAVATTERTVVVKQDELVPQSIAAVQKSVIRIVATGSNQLVARGVIVNSQGLAVTAPGVLQGSGSGLEAILHSGERVPLTVRPDSGAGGVAFLELTLGTSTGFVPAKLVDASKLTLGQTVLRISGAGTDTVGEGVIAALPPAQGERQHVLEASVASATPGAVLLTIFGEVVGIATPSQSPTNDTYTVIVLPQPTAVTNT